MKPQSEHQSTGFSALGVQPDRMKYQWVPEGDGFTLYRILDNGRTANCGRLNTNASVSTHELATLYNQAPTLLRQRDELLAAGHKLLDGCEAYLEANGHAIGISGMIAMRIALANCEKET